MKPLDDIVHFARNKKTMLQKDTGWDYRPSCLQMFSKHHLNALVLLSIESPIELCRFLYTSLVQLEQIINTPLYHHYDIEKKRGGKRRISAPDRQLKKIQKRLNYFLQAWYLWIKPPEVHGFVINPHYSGAHCNIVANAKVHTGKKHILTIDLKDFFPSISAKRIKALFSSPFFNYNEQVSIALTLLTTYEAKLPTGAPTSPVLSNFVCLKLDSSLRDFCSVNDLRFTRYADDLTFSSDTIISHDTILDIILLIRDNGFSINEKKLRIRSSGQKQTVTGLTVNKKVNVDRRLLKKIRAMLFDLKTNGIEVATQRHLHLNNATDFNQQTYFLNRLEGYLNFVGQVRGKNDPIYLRFKQQLNAYYLNRPVRLLQSPAL